MSDGPCILNAVIKSAIIDTGERGALTAWLTLDFGGSGQAFGGYALYLPKSFAHHQQLSHAGHFIFRVMEVAGVDRWSDLTGKTVRAKKTNKWGHILAIGHIVKDDWFNPSADFAAIKEPTK